MNELRSLLGEVRDFFRDDFTWPKYLYALLLIVGFDLLQIRCDVFATCVGAYSDSGLLWLLVPSYYVALYYLMLVPTTLMSGEGWRLRQWQVWVLPLVLIVLQGATQYGHYYHRWYSSLCATSEEHYFLGSLSPYLLRASIVLTGICLFRWLTQRRFALFGLPRNGRYLRVYAAAFLCVLPLVVVASHTSEFLSYYPCFKFWEASGAFGLSDWQLVGAFDVCYTLDYLCTECFFRGALILGLVRWLGPRCVLPMVLVYVAVHAGKPSVEMCSAGVGGLLPGVLAYRTDHLWGGVFAHVAMALSVEFLGSMWHLLQ